MNICIYDMDIFLKIKWHIYNEVMLQIYRLKKVNRCF